jgi:hypothetical protein
MLDPVLASDGLSYEHYAIKLWMKDNLISPVNRMMFPNMSLQHNFELRKAIGLFREKRLHDRISQLQNELVTDN